MSEKFVDARGLSCPEPLLMAQEALKQLGDAAFAVGVSSPTARDNVAALLEKEGRRVEISEDGGDWRINVAAK